MTYEELCAQIDALLYNDCVIIKADSGLYTTLSSRLTTEEWMCVKHYDDTCIVVILAHKTPTKFALRLFEKMKDLCTGYSLV